MTLMRQVKLISLKGFFKSVIIFKKKYRENTNYGTASLITEKINGYTWNDSDVKNNVTETVSFSKSGNV